MINVEKELQKAVKHFWKTRSSQHKMQGTGTGNKDTGNRGAVTGGKHADGFVNLIAEICREAGLTEAQVHSTSKRTRTLPGFFRPTKEWDLVVTAGEHLVAVVEVKSQVGSFGNNFNNRVEEALGNATDFWAAYKQGRFSPSQRPWLGYLFMIEGTELSMAPKKWQKLDHYQMDEAFQALSYVRRYEEVCLRLVRERLYDSACFFISNGRTGTRGEYAEPNQEIGIKNFCRSLRARASVFSNSD